MHPVVIVFRYGEVSLKGRQRSYWEFILRNNIQAALQLEGVDVNNLVIRFVQKRGEVLADPERLSQLAEGTESVLRVLLNTPGIVWAGEVHKLVDLEGIQPDAKGQISEEDARNYLNKAITKALENFKKVGLPRSLEVRRYNKNFPLNSLQIRARFLQALRRYKNSLNTGSEMQAGGRLPLSALILVHKDRIELVYKYPGVGGIPVSSTGKGIVLFSGGIDSPVAAFLAFKRGVRADLLHFAPPGTDIKQSKIYRLYRVLRQYNPYIKLYVTNARALIGVSGQIVNPMVVFRRLMVRVASQLVLREYKRGTIVTGDSLGQVASQTLSNLTAVNSVICEMGVQDRILLARPLLGMDKTEIIDIAKRIGTYNDSITEYKDCCSIIARKSKTFTPLEVIREQEEKFDIDRMMAQAMQDLTIVK